MFTVCFDSSAKGVSLTTLRLGLHCANFFHAPPAPGTPHRARPAIFFTWGPLHYPAVLMPLRRSLQLVSDLPFSQPEPHDDGEANAAAVLAAMPGGQAQLRWATPSNATEFSSGLAPPPSSPGVSAARPPLSARLYRVRHLPGS